MSKLSILVNREHLLSQNYIPQNLTEPAIPFSAPPGDAKRLLVRDAAAAAEELFHRAQKEGLHLWGVSGYRPYTRQRELYEAALVKREKLLKKTGDAPMTAVAPPGSSEHQTGLALDVSCPSENYELKRPSPSHQRENGSAPMPPTMDLSFAIPEVRNPSPDSPTNHGTSVMWGNPLLPTCPSPA